MKIYYLFGMLIFTIMLFIIYKYKTLDIDYKYWENKGGWVILEYMAIIAKIILWVALFVSIIGYFFC